MCFWIRIKIDRRAQVRMNVVRIQIMIPILSRTQPLMFRYLMVGLWCENIP